MFVNPDFSCRAVVTTDQHRWVASPQLGVERVMLDRLGGERARATSLVRYAQGNHVSMLVMGAATHGLQMQRFLATVPIKVAMGAPCTVILVKQQLPFEQLAR